MDIYDCWHCRHNNNNNPYGIDYCNFHETRCSFCAKQCDDFEDERDSYNLKLMRSGYSYKICFFAVVCIVAIIIICAVIRWVV
jgi:hypothetical protein